MFWNIIIGIASYFLNLVLAPKPQNAKPASLEDFDLPTAEEGIEIPVVFGTVHIKNPNVVWYGDLKIIEIKGARRYGFFGPRQITGHKYRLGMHMILCHGTHDEIREIWVTDEKLWPWPEGVDEVATGTTTIHVDRAKMFGGEEKEGGIEGLVDVLDGGPAQAQNAYLADAIDEPNLPAFRGVVSIVWNRVYVGTNSYVKPWEFVLKRIHKTSAGVEQWYDAKAAVPDTHVAAGTDTGVELLESAVTHNSENKIDSNGDYAARVNEGTDPDDGYVAGSLNVWTLPAGTKENYNPPNPPSGPYPTGKYGSQIHITEFDEVIVQYSGSAWANVDVYLSFRNASNPSSTTQVNMNLTEVFDLLAITTWTNLNYGFTAGERGDYLLLKMGPTVYPQNPWLLLVRGGSDWEVHSAHEGSTVGGSSGGTESISMGPRYAYCLKGYWSTAGCARVQWHPDYAWEETEIDLAALGATGEVTALSYSDTTDEVVAVSNTGVFVFNSTLTTLLRSRTTWPYPLSYGITSKRFWASSSSFVLHATNAVGYNYLWEINVTTLETDRETNVYATNYVNKTGANDGPMYFNRDVGGIVIGKHFLMPISFWPYSPPDALDMNPAHIIRECLTDPIWGMGYNAADIDDDAFEAAADTLWDECFGLSLQWNREERIEEFISVILAHIDAYLYLRRTTGKFYLKLIRDDYVLESLPVFDEDDVVEWEEIARREPAEAINSVIVKYTNRRGEGRGKTASHSFDNIAQITQLGERISATRVYPGISRGDLATQVAARDQQSLGIGLISGRVTGKRTFDVLYPGDPFRIVATRHNLDGEVMRVASMKFGDGRDNKIGVKFAQDVFKLGAADLIDTSQGDWESPVNPPAAVFPRWVWEMPYWHLREMIGPSDSTTLLTEDVDGGMIAAAGGRPTGDAIDARIYTDAVAQEVMGFAPAGLLSLLISPFETEISLDDAVDEELIEVGMLAVIVDDIDDVSTAEIVQVTAVDGVDLTISRGFVDTVPRSHAAGATVVVFDQSSMSDFDARTATDAPVVQLLTRTLQGSLELELAPEDTVVMDSRAIRPLRPADVEVEGDGVGPVDGTGLIEFETTWSNRNRLTADSVTLAWTDATVDPEAGQTAIIEVLDPTAATVLTTYSGISGTLFAVPLAAFDGNPTGWIRVGAERDGYREWQAHRIEVYVELEGTSLLYLEDDPLLLESESLYLGVDALAIYGVPPAFASTLESYSFAPFASGGVA